MVYADCGTGKKHFIKNLTQSTWVCLIQVIHEKQLTSDFVDWIVVIKCHVAKAPSALRALLRRQIDKLDVAIL